jgi:NO-binding membrane sensor protein with MHYT domain
MEISGTYNAFLVGLSYLTSVLGAFTSFRLAKEISEADPGLRWLWLAGAASAMGGGAIWSMHFIGMLAFDTNMDVAYDPWLTTLSLVLAIVVVGFGLWVVSREKSGFGSLLLGGLLMGSGVATMHYTGMAAMQMDMTISYDSTLFNLSIVIAVVASIAALWLVFNMKKTWQIVGSAMVMGIAVCGMHYTGMAAATLTPSPGLVSPDAIVISPELLAYAIFVVTVSILSMGWVLGGKQPDLLEPLH